MLAMPMPALVNWAIHWVCCCTDSFFPYHKRQITVLSCLACDI